MPVVAKKPTKQEVAMKYPTSMPATEVIRRARKEHGVELTANNIYTARSQAKKNGAGPAREAAPSQHTVSSVTETVQVRIGDEADRMIRFWELVAEIGADRAREMINVFERIRKL